MEVETRFEPNLIVTSPDGTEMALVVAVGRDEADRNYVEEPLKQHMLAKNCPVGMFIVPGRIWIYRNRYLSNDQGSIEVVGAFNPPQWPPASLPQPFVGTPAAAAAVLDPFVQGVRQWLESLDTASLSALPSDLRTAVKDHVLPVLAEGELRAGVPRHTS